MIFTTYWFVIAIVVFLSLHWLVRAPLFRKYWLLIFCVVFHGHFAGPAGVIPILINGFIVYFCGRSQKPWALKAGIVLSVGSLVWYKYTHFFAAEILGLFSESLGVSAASWAKSQLPPAPPLAISFFAFEFVHYLFDVLKGSAPIRSLTNFWCFTLFFPSLVAGPIKRYEQFIPALDEGLAKTSADDISTGLLRVSIGFVKKLLIADNLTTYIDFQYPQFATLSILDRWIFVVLISLRILMDFSGYSDIAIGLARIIGVRIPENFNWPYRATDIRDFWQRWHISLSNWIRDYVYIPIGGNRRGVFRTVFNGIFAFALCGLWHGPTWNFVFWGLLHGFALALSSNYQKFFGAPGRALKQLFTKVPVLSWALTMAFVGVGWLYFFYSFSEATRMFVLLWKV
jgi:alginate O-acetyltransferase complex protein AlgI